MRSCFTLALLASASSCLPGAEALMERSSTLGTTDRANTEQRMSGLSSRALLDTDDPVPQRSVSTAQELAELLKNYRDSEVGHVVLQDHLDLTMMTADEVGSYAKFDFSRFEKLKSIRGNCTDAPDESTLGLPPAAARLREFRPGQCLILTDGPAFYVWNTAVWIDNVYVRQRQITRSLFDQLVEVSGSSSISTQLWITNSTFQGDGNGQQDCEACGVSNAGGHLYAQGCTFADLDGNAIVHVAKGASASFVECSFIGNTLMPSNSLAGVIETDNYLTRDLDSEVRLEQCTFEDNSADVPALVADNRHESEGSNVVAQFYSDDTSMQVCVLQDGTIRPGVALPCTTTIAPKGLDTISNPFLSLTHPILSTFQQEIGTLTPVPVPDAPGTIPAFLATPANTPVTTDTDVDTSATDTSTILPGSPTSDEETVPESTADSAPAGNTTTQGTVVTDLITEGLNKAAGMGSGLMSALVIGMAVVLGYNWF